MTQKFNEHSSHNPHVAVLHVFEQGSRLVEYDDDRVTGL